MKNESDFLAHILLIIMLEIIIVESQLFRVIHLFNIKFHN